MVLIQETKKGETKNGTSALVPFLALMTVNMLAGVLFNTLVQAVINLLGAFWYGAMFNTWFRNQLLVNGYQVQKTGA